MNFNLVNPVEAQGFCRQNSLGFQARPNWLSFCFVLCITLLMAGRLSAWDPGAIPERGVYVLKEHSFHDDASSKAFEYDGVKQDDQVTWFYYGGKGRRFEKREMSAQIFNRINFPPYPYGEIVNQDQFESLKYQLGNLEAFTRRYPNAEKYLGKVIDDMREDVRQFESGKVFFDGEWITPDEYKELERNRGKKLKNYASNREEQEKKQLQREREEAKLMQSEHKERSKHILIASGSWLLFLILAFLIKSRVAVWIFMLSLVFASGWFTYEASGFGWTEDLLRALHELPSYLPLLK